MEKSLLVLDFPWLVHILRVFCKYIKTRSETEIVEQWFTRLVNIKMSMMASQITGVSIVYSTICSGADQRKHQSSASLAFVRGIHRWPVNSPHKRPVMRKMFLFDDVIMQYFSWSVLYIRDKLTSGHCIIMLWKPCHQCKCIKNIKNP